MIRELGGLHFTDYNNLKENRLMSIIFQSLGRTVIAGIVILALLLVFAGTGLTNGMAHAIGLRWLHVVCGVMWIGLLWYFNFVQIPTMPKVPDELKKGVSGYIAPAALFWFRWAAVATWLTGAWLLGPRLMPAFTLQEGNTVIGIGAWLGTIMLFNVWVLIWPNQKKVLGIVPATDDEKAKARKTATLASRTNFLLSIPMLMCMIGPSHGLPF